MIPSGKTVPKKTVLLCKDRCKDSEDCPQFSTSIVIGSNGEPTENVRRIPGDEIECCYCHGPAEWVEQD